MNIQQITYIVEINRHNSFSAAASALFISQPRLSQAVKELEEELGFDIFERNRKGIVGPTLKGYEFIHHAKRVLREFNSLNAFKETAGNSFRLTTTLIPQAQNAFVKLSEKYSKNKNINFEMFFCGCFESADKLKNGNYHLGIVTVLNIQLNEWLPYFDSNDLSYQCLLESPFYITVHKDCPLAECSSISESALKDYVYITEKCSKMNNLTLQVYSLFDSFFSGSRITVSNTDIMYTLAHTTNSFILDSFPLDENTKKKYDLVSIPFDNPRKVQVGYISHKHLPLSTLSQDYIELLKTEFDLLQ